MAVSKYTLNDILYAESDREFLLTPKSNLLFDVSDNCVVATDPDSEITRRIWHTVQWCFTNDISHRYDQVIFDYTDQAHEIYFRHFYFDYHDNQIVIKISKLALYNDAIITGKFESNLFDSISDAVVLTLADPFDAPGPKIVYCNKTFSDMTGYSFEELLGRSPRLLQGQESSVQAKRNIRVALEKWQSIKQHMVNYRKDGSIFDVELNISPVKDESGWFSHWISVQRDMSGHKEILEHLRTSNLILRSSGTACWYLVFSKDQLYWDEQMNQLHNLAPDESVTLPKWLGLISAADRDSFGTRISKAISGESELDFEYRLELEDGSCRWLRIRAELTKEENLPQTLSGICFDITLEKESQMEIERHQKISEENAKLASLGQLAAGVGHEINNPLSVITASIDLLDIYLGNAIAENENVSLAVERMVEASDRIARIVNGLRSVSSLTRDSSELTTVNLAKDIVQTVEMMSDLYAKEGITVELRVPEELSACEILAEHAGLQQILVNLLSNAKDAVRTTTDKYIEVSVKEQLNTCTLTVNDSGTGIAEAIQSRVFEPFASLKAVGEGTGLGLSITQSIVESFGGSVGFETSMGEGTTFICTFNKSQSGAASFTHSRANKGKASFLLVEDDMPVAECTLALIHSLGCQCEHAINGKDAVEKLKTQGFDIILTDLKMPVMTGWEFLELLKERSLAADSMKFIMTGEIITHNEVQFKKLKSYSDGILQKPVKRIDLANLVEQYHANTRV